MRRGRAQLSAALTADRKICGLDSREWDFRELLFDSPTLQQKQELRCAVFYEYARESPTIRSLVETIRQLMPVPGPALTGSDWQALATSDETVFFTTLPLACCVLNHPGFPQAPWLRLPVPLRQQLVKASLRASTLWEVLEPESVQLSELSSASHKKYFGTIEKVAMAIDWSAGTNDDIIETFAAWVRNDGGPTSFPSPRSDSSRENVAAAFLSRLAVARLLNHHPHADALNYALEHCIPMYKQQGKAAQTRKLVRDDIRRIFGADYFKKVFEKEFIPPDELPLCWELAKRSASTKT